MAKWGTAALIESDDTGDALAPKIAFDSMGNAIAVWEQSTFVNNARKRNIWANRYVAGSGWGTAVIVGPSIDPAARSVGTTPQIAVDRQGNAIAVWEEQAVGESSNIWANRYVVGAGWGTAARIQTGTDGAYDPQIAVDASGNAWAVWQQKSPVAGINFNIVANHYVVGAGWGVAARIEAHTNVIDGTPQVAVDANGNVLTVWRESTSGNTDGKIWANRYTAGSGWGTAALIETESASDARHQRIAFDSSGNAIAVWEQINNQNLYEVVVNRYSVGSGWGTTTTHLESPAQMAFAAHNPAVAFDNNGSALAVWTQDHNGGIGITWSASYFSGTGWGAPAPIQTDGGLGALAPQIAIDVNGNAIAVWTQVRSDNSHSDIWANRYTTAIGWGTAAPIETNSLNVVQTPQIAIDTNGKAISVWSRIDNPGVYSIWASRFE